MKRIFTLLFLAASVVIVPSTVVSAAPITAIKVRRATFVQRVPVVNYWRPRVRANTFTWVMLNPQPLPPQEVLIIR